jgi:hypothetical protein
MVDGTPIGPPHRLAVTGPADTVATALETPARGHP